ncbi:YtjB family periplasmic protein [Vibrio sp. SS-MA-C1-2]|uniref:AhpA/YtjB family protein n=1 Tax=Vibrio sp. SS-MA-C1-2 TaxID=2908646 RepID=UPI001F3019D1|nr:AhpA/YtjB family protein [Vibrio sp. SS-MA-C1-2]UJF19720.1 YtjB family periplasmic protein [Vibrio sp. SS-MA-C1-2]
MRFSQMRWKNIFRLISLLIIVGLVAVMMQLSIQITKANQQELNQQTDKMAALVLNQASLSASDLIREKKQKQLGQLTEQLASSELLLDATIYDSTGVILAQSHSARPLDSLLGLATPLGVEGYGRQQLAKDVISDGELIGFIRLTLNHHLVVSQTEAQLEKNSQSTQVMIIIALILGFSISRIFIRRNRNLTIPLQLSK